MKKLISSLVLFLFSLVLLPITPPEVKAETSCGMTAPQVVLSEFSFNNTLNDFVELTVVDDGNHGLGQILDNYAITSIDANVKTIPTQTVKTGDKLKFSDIPGLTATTDQLVLTHNADYIDAVCWTSATPTEQEKSDFTKLTTANAWNGSLVNCLSSSNLEKNTSFRRKQNIDTNSSADWEIVSPTTAIITPVIPPVISAPTSASPIATNEIIINEFLPDPEGSDDGNEWIELKNTSDHSVSLLGWQIDDEEGGGSKPYSLGDITIGGESFLLLKNDKTNITLNNSADAVRLINPSGVEYEKIPYAKIAPNESWARTTSHQWKLTKTLTPGEENVMSDVIIDQASQIVPPDPNATITPATDPTVIISEILPNPTGTDNGNEWIEINNKTSTPVSLAGWRITNGSGKTFLFPASSIIPANGYIILTDQETKITLKNSADQIEILDPLGQIQNSISYEEAPENTSFAEIATIPLSGTGTTTLPQISILNWLIPTANAQSIDSPEQIAQEDRETSWEWTQMITKGEANPTFLKINGQVTREPDNSNTFALKANQQELIISFDPKKTDAQLLKSVFKLGAAVQVKAIKTNKGEFALESYSLQNKQLLLDAPSNGAYGTLIITGLLLLGAAAITARTYLKKAEITSPHDPILSEEVDTQPHISLT